ncbi:MAG: glycosyltransferase [Desulfobacterales bacterium]|nr:glycosyltransferase [Desulfobacterales bacterium]
MELTILMPCLNEAETLGACVDKALRVPGARRGRAARCSSPTTAARDGSPAIAAGQRGAGRAGRRARLRRGAARRHRGRPRALHHHGRRRRQLRFLAAEAVS